MWEYRRMFSIVGSSELQEFHPGSPGSLHALGILGGWERPEERKGFSGRWGLGSVGALQE